MKYGDKVTLKDGARWTNSVNGEVITKTLPAGTTVMLESWRPEGWIVLCEDGSRFFLFERYLTAK